MADIQYYERVLKKKEPRGKLLMLALYLVILSVWFVVAIRYALNAAIILLIPLSILIAVLLTWKYTCVEYEYSFAAGTFTFSKIYGKSKRKTVFSADIKSLVLAKPYDPARDTNLEYSAFIGAIPSREAQNPCICIFDVDEKRTCVLLDCDELSAKILRFFNASAVDRDIFKRTVNASTEDNNA